MKRKISIGIALAMLLNVAVPFNASAAAGSDSAISANTPAKIAAVNNAAQGLNQRKLTEEEIKALKYDRIIDILMKNQSYSKASKSEIKKLCDYYKIQDSVLKECEEKGYTLQQSVDIATTIDKSKITVTDVKDLEKKEKSLTAALDKIEKMKAGSITEKGGKSPSAAAPTDP